MLNVAGLFSGIGGFELGLQRSGMNIKSLCEIDSSCVSVLKKHFQDTTIYNDINELPSDALKDIDVLCGGFPCQDISIAGGGMGISGKKSGLWKVYKNVIKTSLPKYAVIENVSALRSRGLNVILQDLAEIGYDACWTMLDSKFFGQPNRRRRVYIIAVRDGIPAEADILKFKKRNTDGLRYEVEHFDSSFEWDFTAVDNIEEAFTYVTRQRTDRFTQCGLSSTLCKRDYKSYTDLVISHTGIRRVTPQERLVLHNFPRDYFDGCNLTTQEQFKYCGMCVNTVKWLGECILEFDYEYG